MRENRGCCRAPSTLSVQRWRIFFSRIGRGNFRFVPRALSRMCQMKIDRLNRPSHRSSGCRPSKGQNRRRTEAAARKYKTRMSGMIYSELSPQPGGASMPRKEMFKSPFSAFSARLFSADAAVADPTPISLLKNSGLRNL